MAIVVMGASRIVWRFGHLAAFWNRFGVLGQEMGSLSSSTCVSLSRTISRAVSPSKPPYTAHFTLFIVFYFPPYLIDLFRS